MIREIYHVIFLLTVVVFDERDESSDNEHDQRPVDSICRGNSICKRRDLKKDIKFEIIDLETKVMTEGRKKFVVSLFKQIYFEVKATNFVHYKCCSLLEKIRILSVIFYITSIHEKTGVWDTIVSAEHFLVISLGFQQFTQFA